MLKKSISLLLLMSLSVAAVAQGIPRGGPPTNQPAPSRPTQDDDDRIRIDSNLVQVDAVVTDAQGQPVADLKAEDFEVFEDGKKQELTNFLFINPPTQTLPETPKDAKGKDKVPLVAPPVNLDASQVGRTMAIVIDDLCMSQSGLLLTQAALRTFVTKTLQPNDLVALYRTHTTGQVFIGGMFTNNQAQLLKTVNSLRWSLVSDLNCSTILDRPFSSDFKGSGEGGFESQASRESRERGETFARERTTIGRLGTLRYIIGGLERLPGRKSILFMSDGLERTSDTLDALRRLTEFANRASVVVNTFDARGLQPTGFISAQDSVRISQLESDPARNDESSKLRDARTKALLDNQDTLNYLAEATGGTAIRNINFDGGDIRRVTDAQRSYYLLGYRPGAETLKQKGTIRKITVKVLRPGLKVTHRRGFFGIKTEQPNRKRTADTPLYEALASPLATNGMNLRFAPFFGYDAQRGYFMRSVIRLEPNDLTFVDQSDGSKKLSLDVAVVAFGENGKIMDDFLRSHTLTLPTKADWERVLANGLVYTADVPIKKPGGYQLRLAFRDNATQRIGSVNQYVEVPDLSKKRLALSGLVVGAAQSDGTSALPPYTPADAAFAPATPINDLATRIFRPGTIVSYSYVIYNARLAGADKKPNLKTSVRLYREGKLIVETPEEVFDVTNQKDLARLAEQRYLRLNANSAPGNYTLQVIVKDLADDSRTASQALDFEIVN